MGKKSVWLSAAAVFVALISALCFARVPLTGWALRRGLSAAGATDVAFRVTGVSLRRIAVADLGLRLWREPIRAAEVTLTRDRPLAASLGRLEVRGLVAEIASADVPRLEAAARAAGKTTEFAAPPRIPLDGISVDGRVVIKTGVGDEAVSLDFAAEPAAAAGGAREPFHWQGRATVAAPGLTATLAGDYDFQAQTGAFQLVAAQADLAKLRAFAGALRPLPLADWEAGGTLTLTGAGSWRDGKLAAHGEVHLRDGHLADVARGVALDGIAADLDFTDLGALTTAPAQPVNVARVTLGQVMLTKVAAQVQLAGAHDLRVAGATAEAFGGRLALAPFQFDPARVDYAFTAELAGLQLEQLQPLLPAQVKQARGLIDGSVPVRYDAGGLHLGRGWLRLHGDTPAFLLCRYPDGMLTQDLGIDPRFAAYPALKEVEGARLPLRVTALSVELHPPGGPAGRYATIHLEGEPDDPRHKVPIDLDLNLNGPVEALINWGLNTRLNLSSGR